MFLKISLPNETDIFQYIALSENNYLGKYVLKDNNF